MNSIDIIWEDDAVIICHKPAGIATQTRRVGQPDMESMLRSHRAKQGEDTYIGIVHRLDQPVEGIMVFAKTPTAAGALSGQVKGRRIGKHYYAVVHMPERGGADCTLSLSGGRLTDNLTFDPGKNYASVVPPEHKNGKQAILEYQVMACGDGKALLDILLHTGRHHQIRVQLAHAGCPIAGDTKYGEGQEDANTGLALCAYRLEFIHPTTGKRVDISIKPQNSEIRKFTKMSFLDIREGLT